MSSVREADKLARDDVAGLREWVRPIVHGFAAVGAEDDSGTSSDGILNPS